MKRWDVVATVLGMLSAALLAVAVALGRAVEDPSWLAFCIASLPSLVLGWVIARRRPANIVGVVLMLVGVLPLLTFALEGWQATALGGDPLPGSGSQALAAAADTGWMWLYIGPILLALVFPDGRLVSRRWRIAVAGCILVPLGFQAGAYADVPPDTEAIVAVPFLAGLFALLIASVCSVRLRYARADEQARRQIRWLALAAFLAPTALAVCWLSYATLGSADLVGFALVALFIALPVCVAVAMLRHHLYGFDRILSGTVLWVAVVASLGLLYSFVAVFLGLAVGGSSPVVAGVATLACCAAFFPVHRYLRRQVDARFQPRRERALAAARDFVAAVRRGTEQPEALAAVLGAAVDDAGLQVVTTNSASHIVLGDASSLTAADLLALEAEARFPLELARLRGDLREALQLTEASRSRIALAADDERGRIQRNLHDGAQQNLVALGMRLRQMERHPETPPTAPDLAEAVELVQRTISELRSLAHGVRPSSLDDGLEPALRAMARSVPVRVDLDLEPVTVSEPSATAAYYMAAEAVTNALKHSRATRIGISLAQDSEGTRVGVQDDGCGGAVVSGSGLAGIRDRIEAAGGRLVIDSAAARGTRVEAIFPRAAHREGAGVGALA